MHAAPRPLSMAQAHLFAKHAAHASQHAVLVGVVGVVFAGDLEDGGEGCRVGVDAVPYPVGDLEASQRGGARGGRLN